jgi:hypothetical protein
MPPRYNAAVVAIASRRLWPLLLVLGCMPAAGCVAHKHVVGLGPTGLGEVSQRQYYMFFGLLNLTEVNVQNLASNLTSYSIETEYAFTDFLLMPFFLPLTVTTRTVTVKT